VKIDYHSIEMGIFCSPIFFDKLQEFCDKLNLYDEKIKRVQCYSSFFEPSKNYPFKDSNFVYYPLTLVYSKKKWNTLWICWPRSVLLENVKKNTPGVFSPFLVSTEDFEITICENVPMAFTDFIADMNLCYFKNSNYCMPCHGLSSFEHAGEVNQSFLDSLSDQISEILYNLSGYKLSKWDIELRYSVNGKYSYKPIDTIMIDGIHYRDIYIKDSNAFSRSVVVSWSGEYDTSDYIKPGEVKFSLSDYKINPDNVTIAEAVNFIRRQEGHCLYSYPDVVMHCHSSLKLSPESKKCIVKTIEGFILDWNGKKEHPIHYYSLLENNSEKSVSIHMDFGNCEPEALEKLYNVLVELDFINKIELD